MIREMVEAFVDANMDRADISVALHQVAADVGGPLIKRINQRSRKTVEAMLETASDIKSPPDKFAIDLMLSATGGRRCVPCWRLDHRRRRPAKREA